jgi:pimeloyl-ACP methyl ester carboxylesterase
VQSIVGPSPNLNRVTYLRTYLAKAGSAPPRAILILVPGFLGGGGTFSPLAKQLVAKFNGSLEVWAIDRRPNQLEDRRGSLYAQQLLANATTPDEVADAIYQGVFFYLPESDGVDTNQNGEVDPPTELPDALGNQSSYVRLAQDDMRFAAHWGLDTYARDWRSLVDAARSVVGPGGLVLFGGHSMGTYYASAYAAYDFNPDPSVVDAGYRSIDGILLLEGGGGRGPSASAPDLATYQSTVASLATPGGPEIFLQSFQGIEPALLGPAAEMAGLAGVHLPDDAAIVQRTSVFLNPPFSLFFNAPTTNRGAVGFFIDDDFQPFTAFRASVGFSDDGTNLLVKASPPLFTDPFYIASANGDLRQWKDFDDPTLPSCPPSTANTGAGCAIIDNGPRPAPNATPKTWGVEREVTSLDDILGIQFSALNFIEWYYLSGRTNLDGSYGVDSSALVAQAVAATGSEGPLVLTQNAHVDVPVLCIGGSNGLAPLESSFAPYLASIATPAADEEVHIIEGYAHLDMIAAKKNDAVPLITDWVNRLMVRKLLAP